MPIEVMKPPRLSRKIMLEAVSELCARDADLRQVIARHGPPPLWARRPGFETLVRIVLEQQVSLASARAAFTRLQTGTGRVEPAQLAPLPIAEFQRLGITRQKAAYIQGIAQSILNGELELPPLARADHAGTRDVLLGIRGVGPWTADIYLIMALRHPDVWPDGDLALNISLRRIKRLRSIPSADRARKIAAVWKPWRSVAARILWHHYLSEA